VKSLGVLSMTLYVMRTHSLRKWLFSLVTEHGFNKRNIGLKYQITYLYVPTVVSEIEYQIKNIADYSKVSSIKEQLVMRSHGLSRKLKLLKQCILIILLKTCFYLVDH
jgi:hypothetical protein